ncbi:MAG: DUF3857 domain-containing protein [Candidatus Omnitrophota bacterium]
MKNKYIISAIFVLGLCGCSPSQARLWWADRLAVFSEQAAQTSARLYEEAIRKLPSGRQKDRLCRKLGSLYLSTGDFEKAVLQLRACPLPDQALLGEALFKKGDYTQALDVFNRMGEEGSPKYLYYYAMTLERSNLHDQALKFYQRLTQDPSFGERARERITQINLADRQAFAGVEPEVRELIEKSPGPEDYPEAGILYLLTDENITLNKDDQLVSEHHYVVKILNDRGKENFGEISLQYDSTYETVELEYARTIKPDGTVVTVGDKNIRDVSLYLNFPLYSNARMRIISMPEVAPGSILEYKVRLLRTKLVNKKDFDSLYWLQSHEPVLWQKFRVTVPEDVELRFKVVNDRFNPGDFNLMPEKAEGRSQDVVYTMESRDVPQIIPEPAMPTFSRINPYLLMSTFSSWEEIYRWWKGLYQDKFEVDDAMTRKTGELTKGLTTRREKIRAIYGFCAQDVRYVAVEYGDAGYEPHDAREVFRNKYGDCKDKAILLVAMLRIAGIEAYPVLISTANNLENYEDLPSLVFNHAIAAVRMEEGLVFMDPTASTVAFGDLPEDDQDRLVLVFFPDRYELVKTPLFTASHNRAMTRTRIRVEEDESIRGERSVETWGVFRQSQRYWVKFTMPALIEEAIKQRIRSISENGTLLDYTIKNADDLDKPVDFSYRFAAPRYFISAGSTRIMNQASGFDTSVVARENRRYPLDTGSLRSQEEVLEVELPPHFAVKYLPEPVNADTKWFTLTSRYEHKGRVLKYAYIYSSKLREVSQEEYAEYKKTVEYIASQLNQQVILEDKKAR